MKKNLNTFKKYFYFDRYLLGKVAARNSNNFAYNYFNKKFNYKTVHYWKMNYLNNKINKRCHPKWGGDYRDYKTICISNYISNIIINLCDKFKFLCLQDYQNILLNKFNIK